MYCAQCERVGTLAKENEWKGRIHMNWLLIVVIAVIGVCGWAGYQKGLVKVMFSLIMTLFSLVLVGFISPFVANFLQEHTPMHEYIKEKSGAMVAEWNESREGDTEESRFAAIDSYEMPDFFKSYFKSEHTEEALKLDFNDYIGDKVADLVIRAASFVITFLVIALVLVLLSVLLDIVMKLPVLKSLNRVAGLVAGLVVGLLVVWIFFLVITLICSTEFGKECMRMIGDDRALSFLYNINPLMQILT